MSSDYKKEVDCKYLDDDEQHKNHYCIDELVCDLTDYLKKIEKTWIKKGFGCKSIKREISRLISLSNDHETLLNHLKNFSEELKESEDEARINEATKEGKIGMKSIYFFDGESDGAFIPRTMEKWSEANGYIISHALKMSPSSNYHKHFFKITFNDGFEYEGRYDVSKAPHENIP